MKDKYTHFRIKTMDYPILDVLQNPGIEFLTWGDN